MALRTKTIEYVLPSNTAGLAATTRYDWGSQTLYVPETASRTFKSVTVRVSAKDGTTTAASMTAFLIGAKLGAASSQDVEWTSTVTNSGDHNSWEFVADFTAYFASNFGAGASQSFVGAVRFTGPVTTNISYKLLITYEFDDASATTRIKTVRIPLDAPTSVLTATLTEIGTNQVPDLDDFLPESSKVYRDMFFEIWTNDAGNATTTFALGLQLDSEAETSFAIQQQALNTAVACRYIWKRTDMATNVVHAFKARSNNLASRFTALSVVLVVTYEYDHGASTRIMNSLMIPVLDEPGHLQQGQYVWSVGGAEFFIAEPGTITLVQSGVFVTCQDTGTVNLGIEVGNANEQTYTLTAGSVQSGGAYALYRVDAGAAGAPNGNAAVALSRGRNSVRVYARGGSSAGTMGSMVTGVLYLNYTSDKAAAGADAHNRTTWQTLYAMSTNASVVTSVAQKREFYPYGVVGGSGYGDPYLSQSKYWLNAVGFRSSGMATFAAAAYVGATWAPKAGENGAVTDYGDGSEPAFSQLFLTDAELGVYDTYPGASSSRKWKRHPDDPDVHRYDVEATQRYWQLESTVTWFPWLEMFLTYHEIAFTVAGNVVDYDGDGSGISCYLHRANTSPDHGEVLSKVLTAAGGGYSFTWYDDVESVYVDAYQNGSHLGRSANGVAS
ncbi:MAG: hypothetical protein ACOYB2_10530 [Limnohabitans sp.]